MKTSIQIGEMTVTYKADRSEEFASGWAVSEILHYQLDGFEDGATLTAEQVSAQGYEPVSERFLQDTLDEEAS